MIRPFKGTFPVTQEWGVNPASYIQFGLKGHNGVDYGTPTGTPIIAPHAGKVIEAAFDQYGYGMYVKIENDVEGSILAHFESFNVNPGDIISEGQQVGISDNTGNSTGPHLHWGYYRMPRNKSDGFSGTTNPYPYLSENPPQTQPDDCQTKLKEKTELETFLRGVITGKDIEINSLKIDNKTLSDKLTECQNSSNSSVELQDKLNKLQLRYDKLKKMPSKAQLELLIKICDKLEIQV